MKKIRNIAFIFAALMAPAVGLHAEDVTIDLRPATSTAEIYRITSQLEGTGTVIPNGTQSLKLSLKADFQYDERIIARKKSLKSIRDYQLARAEIRLGNGSMVNRLDDEHRVILSQISPQNSGQNPSSDVLIASVQGQLTQNEFDLINTPANTLIAAQLLTKNQVEIGQSWRPNNRQLALWLNIDSIQENDVRLKLEAIDDKIAEIFINGDLVGSIDGAKTEISLRGKARFDTQRGQIRDMLITINQQRDIGLLSPGLEAVFKIKTEFQPIGSNDRLTNQALNRLQSAGNRITDSLQLESADGQYVLVHPHAWRVIRNHSGGTTLRYIRDGRMLGQCDIIPLPRRPAEQPQTIEQLKQSVEHNLSDNQAVIIDSGQSTTPSGLEWIRVDASGSSDNVPLHWSYYVINHSDGRRVQLVFTTEPALAATFGGADLTLVNSIAFADITAAKTQNASFKQQD